MRHAEPSNPAGRGLTPRRRKIVEIIEDSVRRNGYAPSMREIGEAVGLASTSSVSYQLSVLENEGYLTREARRPRTAALRTLAPSAAERGPVQTREQARERPAARDWPRYRSSGGSRPAAPSSPTSTSRTSSRCPASWSATVSSSCSGSSATR